jgi:AhpD family alkylhydroperoxidase
MPWPRASAEGALDKKTKELIALAIGVTQHCDGCIGFHGKALVDLRHARGSGRSHGDVRLHGGRPGADVCRRCPARL